MKRVLLALAFLLAPALAQAETCTFAAGSSNMAGFTVTGAGFTATCTASNDDTFIVPSGAYVRNSSSVTLTTGKIQVTGGTFVLSAGTTLTAPVSIEVSGGEFVAEGTVVYAGRVQSVTWGNFATGATITLPDDVSTEAAATDFVVYGDDDPVSASTAIRGSVQVGSGDPSEGVVRPSFEKWRWYDISSVSAKTIVYDYDRHNALGGSATTYGGTRGPCVASAAAATGITRNRYGFASNVTFATGTVAATGDCGDQWLEVTSGTCSGKMAKVIHTIDGGGSDDTFTVAGDLSGCGATPDIRVVPGARAGDPIKVVRPAVIDGGGTGYILWSGGKIRARYARFYRLGGAATTVATPALGMKCSFCIYESSDSVSPASGSYIMDSEIAYGTITASDAAVIGVFGGTQSAARYSGAIDMSGIRFERIHAHDQLDDVASAGWHGFVSEGARNLTVSRYRVERNGDDGAFVLQNNYSSGTLSTTMNEFLSLANFSNDSNSQQGLDISTTNGGSGATHYAETSGTVAVNDALLTGCNDNCLNHTGVKATFNRMIVGGAGRSTGGENWVGNNNSFTGFTSLISERYPNRVSSSAIFSYGPSTSAARTPLNAIVKDSIVSHGGTGGAVYNVWDLRRSFIDTQAGQATYTFLSVGSTWLQTSTLNMEDVVAINSNGSQFGTNWGDIAALTSMTLRRIFAAVSTGANPGYLSSDTYSVDQVATNGATVEGFIFAPTTLGRGIGANASVANGAQLTNVCQAVSTSYARDSANVCGTAASSTCLTMAEIGPKATSDGTLRQFLYDPNGTTSDVCNSARPRALGLAEVGPSWLLLGDFAIAQAELWSSRTLIKPVSGGVGGLPSSF